MVVVREIGDEIHNVRGYCFHSVGDSDVEVGVFLHTSVWCPYTASRLGVVLAPPVGSAAVFEREDAPASRPTLNVHINSDLFEFNGLKAAMQRLPIFQIGKNVINGKIRSNNHLFGSDQTGGSFHFCSEYVMV